MPSPPRGPRLGGSPSHQRLILANLATQLFEHGRITTTVTKAKRLRPLAERLISKARRGDLHARRQVGRVIRDNEVAHALFAEIGPRYVNRPGGYTRITKIGARKGDNAPLAVIELVEEPMPSQAPAKKAAAKKTAKKSAEKPAEKPADADADEKDDAAESTDDVEAKADADGAEDKADDEGGDEDKDKS